ncbi:NAD(P)-dependent oxidoreductase [Pseudomonas sp. St316]|uniref:NAD(P)-dependent oxidoreductase n=1 Tax=Pseudomonas sp. St316 TaxID=2678257 RepID=UPI001BB3B751|nr:NAD(P)-dependent oxidoreductase [Pseudomonas sp. St316]BBP60038.1 hypothetical protein PHLH4_36280 [Pseudomonas sp. St316]
MKIGYIGLGALGSQLARRFLSHSLCVWDINTAAVDTFKKLGADVAPTAADLARRCDVIFLCLPRSSDVRSALFGPNGLAAGLVPGTLIIDQTSGIPGETRRMAEELAERGIDMMDAAVSASPLVVAEGKATLMVAGSDTVYERALPVLRVITQTIYRCGNRVGDGQAMKMVNNAMNAGCRLGTLEVVAMGKKAGLSLPLMADVLNRSKARNQTTDRMLPALAQGKPSTNFALALMLKDVDQAVALGMSRDVPMPLTALVRALLQIGTNTLGPTAQLEDMVGLIESMAATKLYDGDAVKLTTDGAPQACPEGDAIELVTGAIASLCSAITYECTAAGLRYGLALEDMAQVLEKTSGWSESSRSIYTQLLSSHPLDNTALTSEKTILKAACLRGNDLGAPMLIANAARSLFEQADHQISDPVPIKDLSTFYSSISAVQFKPSSNCN